MQLAERDPEARRLTVRPGVIHKATCLSKTDLTTELGEGIYPNCKGLWGACTRGHSN